MISCMVIDDEPLAVNLLRDYVEKTPFLNLVYAGTQPVQALDELSRQPVDLIFLDIQMPDITGLQFMKIIGNKSRVIFTTAYSEFALDGYEYHAIDYLLKPITFDRFYVSALKAREIFGNNGRVAEVTQQPSATVVMDYIFVKTDSKMVKVFLQDILFIEGLKDYISIHTTTGKLIVLDNLKDIHAGMPGHRFARVHKSFIISLEKIDTIERNRIFIGDNSIPIGDSYREFFFASIKGKQFGGR